MDYNNYDSDGNKKKFNFLDLFFDRKYRARLFLLAYLIFFIIIIVIIRTGASKNNTIDNKSINNNSNEEIKVEDEKDSFFLKEEFSYINSNNYNFEFVVSYNKQEVKSIGKRFDNKFMFNVINDNEVANFVATNNVAKVKKDDEYLIVDYPYVLFNYYDNNVIKNILSDSTYDSNSKLYMITNEKLIQYIDNNGSIAVTNKDANNSIELVKKNNTIVGILFDLDSISSMINGYESSLNIKLEYSDFNLIDDFDINL